MKTYEVKVKSGSGKITTERNHATDELELRRLYETLPDQEILELKLIGNPIDDELARLTQNNPALAAQIAQPTAAVHQMQVQPAPPPVPQYEYFEDGETQLRFNKTKGQLEKQAWVKVEGDDLKNYALIPEAEAEIKPLTELPKVTLMKLDWIPVSKVK